MSEKEEQIFGLLEDVEREADAIRTFAAYYLVNMELPANDRVFTELLTLDELTRKLEGLATATKGD